MSGRKPKHEEENLERWLLTYADLITLLMVFFIVMYAMSNVDAAKYSTLANSLKMALGMQPQGSGLVSTMMTGQKPGNDKSLNLKDKNPPKQPTLQQMLNYKNPKEERQFANMMAQIKQYTKKNSMSGVQARMDTRGLVINLSDKVLFESGKADLSPSAKTVLDAIAGILFQSERNIKVEGHTDNIPINNDEFPSNWHLSTARATSVIMYWISKYPAASSQLSAAGYGEFRPVADNENNSNRARNRRVDIIVLRDIISAGEPRSADKVEAKDLGEKLPAMDKESK